MAEGNFDLASLHVIECGISLNDVENATTEQDLVTIAVLTSQPDLLSDEKISTATFALAFYLDSLQDEVKHVSTFNIEHCLIKYSTI